MSLPPIQSQITFLYYNDLDSAAAFYNDLLALELVIKHELGSIYRAADGAFIGIVDGAKGNHPVREENSVVIILNVDDVDAWYDHLLASGAKILSPPKVHELAPVRSFFFEDPGGYTLEFQEFTKEEERKYII